MGTYRASEVQIMVEGEKMCTPSFPSEDAARKFMSKLEAHSDPQVQTNGPY